jgi:CheY-like chemotaxis protein/HD-like signal output (HDOD) protein
MILVVDDEPVVREPLAASLRAHGHDVVCCGDGPAAIASVRSQAPNLILLDLRMPGMDGIAVLHDIRAIPASASVPVLLLSNATDRSSILQAAKLGIQGYILKSAFSLDVLLERIQRITDAPTGDPTVAAAATNAPPDEPAPAASVSTPAAPAPRKAPAPVPPAPSALPDTTTWPRILTREQLLVRLDQVASGKTVAGVVTELISVTNSSNATMADVVRVIQSDPILATRVLQLANAAGTGSRGRVRTVEDAARNLGVREIQNMAISIGIFGAFPPDERDGFNSMRCWQHSYAVAELFNLLVRERNPEQESMNHLVGLCHDLGEILLRQHFAAEYAQVLAFALAHQLPVHQVESVALGIRHPELISRLLTRIGLPAPAVQSIREFYERQIRENAAGLSPQTQALSWANMAAHGLLLAASPHELVRPITRTEWMRFSASKPPPVFDPAIKRSDILTSTNIMARLPESEERRLILPLIPRHDRRIWYVRPSTFVEFDPLAFAIALCSTATISDALPQGNQWNDIDALVLVGLRLGTQGLDTDELSRQAAAGGRPDLPMLCLVSQDGPTNARGTVAVRSYPISLEDLGRWLATACAGQGVPAAT